MREAPGGRHLRPAVAGIAFTLLLLILPASASLRAQIVPRFFQRTFDALSFRDAWWLASPEGLFQYRSAENVWSARTERNGLLSRRVTRIAADGDVLWIGQERGVTRFDFQSNTFLSYDSARGIPAGAVLSFAFDKDYVWIGTESGAARFDRLIEEWQRLAPAQGLTGARVCEIAGRDELIYLVTEKGINEYDARYERWRLYGDGLPPVRDAFSTPANIWLVCDSMLVRFDHRAKTFQQYPLGEIGNFDGIRELIVEGEGFWILTGSGLWSYDPAADAIRPFLELVNLPDPRLHGIAFTQDGKAIWFNTEAGVSRFERATKLWQHFTEAGGMPERIFRAMFCYGGELMGISAARISTFKTAENRWYQYMIPGAEAEHAAVSIDPARGTWADFGGGYRLDLSGTRSSWLIAAEGMPPAVNFGEQVETVGRNDLRARFTLPGGRTVNAMYNDADFSSLQYGAQYRGAAGDPLQSLQAGDLRAEQGNRSLLQSFGIFGGGGRATLGEKSERYKRSLLELSAAAGHKTSAMTRDLFRGRTKRAQAAVKDVDFLPLLFYRLDALARDIRVRKGSVRLFMTRVEGLAGMREVLPERVVAGVDGEWMILRDGEDFFVDTDRGIVRCDATSLAQSGSPGALSLAAEYTLEGESSPRRALLWHPPGDSQEMKNVYFLGAKGMYPASLRVTFTRSAGGAVPLSAYRLDADGDGLIDPEFVDYNGGYLRFPDPFPFAPEVYADSAVSSVVMDIRCETATTGYRLSRDRLVRGSEVVTVDGSRARAGFDYVLDYTSGFLLFTRDGVVNDDSRIEVEYEYVRSRPEEKYAQATATFSPSDDAQASVSVLRYHPEGSGAQVTTLHGLLEGRLRTEEIDLRVVPEYALMTGSREGAFGILTAFSGGPVRISAQARKLSEGYREPFTRLFPLGRLLEESLLHAEADASPTLRIFTDWGKRSGPDTATGAAGRDAYGSLGAQWFGAGLPSVTLRAEQLFESLRDSSSRRRGVRMEVEYVPAPEAARALGLSSAVLSSYARYMRGEEYAPGGGRASFACENYFLRTAVSPLPLFTLNAYYRGDRKSILLPEGSFGSANVLQKLFGDLVFEELRGLSLAIRYMRDLETMHLPSAGLPWDETSRHSFQIASRFSPGLLLPAFSPFTLELNYREERSSYGKGGSIARPLFGSLFLAGNASDLFANASAVYETRIEWHPDAIVAYYVTGRLTDASARAWSSGATEWRRELTQRFDFQPGSRELYSARLTLLRANSCDDRLTRYAPSVWVENRWSALLLTRFTLDLLWDDQWYGRVLSGNRVSAPAANVTLTFTDPPIIERLELREDLSFQRRVSVYRNPSSGADITLMNDSIASGLYLDLYPHPALFLRLVWSSQWDLTSPGTQTVASLQATLQL